MLSWLIESVSNNWRLLLGLFIAQGILGVCMFEWAWKRTERVRLGEKAMMDEFPSFRRLDVHLWSRSKFYPGCFIMLLPRAIWLFFWLFVIGIFARILFIGQSFDVPLSGWRRTAFNWNIWLHVPLLLLGFGYYLDHTKRTEDDTDYSRYLGPDWRKNKF